MSFIDCYYYYHSLKCGTRVDKIEWQNNQPKSGYRIVDLWLSSSTSSPDLLESFPTLVPPVSMQTSRPQRDEDKIAKDEKHDDSSKRDQKDKIPKP